MLDLLNQLDILSLTKGAKGGGFARPPYWDDVIQYTVVSDPVYNATGGFWEYDDLRGSVDKTPEQSSCLEGDGIMLIDFGALLASTQVNYYNGLTETTFTTNASGEYLIPNGDKVGRMYTGAEGNVTNLWLVEEASGDTLYNSVGSIDATIKNASATPFVVDNNFENYGNLYGFSQNVTDNIERYSGGYSFVGSEWSKVDDCFILNKTVGSGFQALKLTVGSIANGDKIRFQFSVDTESSNLKSVIGGSGQTDVMDVTNGDNEIILTSTNTGGADVYIYNTANETTYSCVSDDSISVMSYYSQKIPLKYESDLTPINEDVFGNSPTYFGRTKNKLKTDIEAFASGTKLTQYPFHEMFIADGELTTRYYYQSDSTPISPDYDDIEENQQSANIFLANIVSTPKRMLIAYRTPRTPEQVAKILSFFGVLCVGLSFSFSTICNSTYLPFL